MFVARQSVACLQTADCCGLVIVALGASTSKHMVPDSAAHCEVKWSSADFDMLATGVCLWNPGVAWTVSKLQAC